jgi:hypothetical protein
MHVQIGSLHACALKDEHHRTKVIAIKLLNRSKYPDTALATHVDNTTSTTLWEQRPNKVVASKVDEET